MSGELRPDLNRESLLAAQTLSSWETSEEADLLWGGPSDRTSHLIGEGAQALVFGDGDDEVVKIPKTVAEIRATVDSWGLGPEVDTNVVIRDLIEARNRLIKSRYYGSLPGDLLGHIELGYDADKSRSFGFFLLASAIFEDAGAHPPLVTNIAIRQPRCTELVNDYLDHASPEEAAEIFRNYTDFICRQWWYGTEETTYKFGTNYGWMAPERRLWGNPLLLLDAGESTKSGEEIYRHVIGKRWRQVFNGTDAVAPPEKHLEAYYKHMDEHLAEDVLLTLWDKDHYERFNAPWRYGGRREDCPKRSPGVVIKAFDDPEWQDFCYDALDDIDHPKAFVMEFDEPISPTTEFDERRAKYVSDPVSFPGMVAYYRQLAPNPLLDNPEKPVWLWELQFVGRNSLDALLAGKEGPIESWGVSVLLREDDFADYTAKFTACYSDRLDRELYVRSNGLGRYENGRCVSYDANMLLAFRKRNMVRHRIIDGYPYIAKPQASNG